jgi:hypothetical protein
MNRRFDPETAHKIFDILRDECGAREFQRQEFVQTATGDGITEFRFQGLLGFGGKVWANMRVSCYTEDASPTRQRMIDRANELLAEVDLSGSVRS